MGSTMTTNSIGVEVSFIGFMANDQEDVSEPWAAVDTFDTWPENDSVGERPPLGADDTPRTRTESTSVDDSDHDGANPGAGESSDTDSENDPLSEYIVYSEAYPPAVPLVLGDKLKPLCELRKLQCLSCGEMLQCQPEGLEEFVECSCSNRAWIASDDKIGIRYGALDRSQVVMHRLPWSMKTDDEDWKLLHSIVGASNLKLEREAELLAEYAAIQARIRSSQPIKATTLPSLPVVEVSLDTEDLLASAATVANDRTTQTMTMLAQHTGHMVNSCLSAMNDTED